MSAIINLADIEVKDHKVLVRVDLNVPMANDKILDTNRIKKILPTINYIRKNGGKAIIISHFARPKGNIIKSMSLFNIIKDLANALNCKVHFADNCIGQKAHNAVNKLQSGEVLLLENLRFHKEEEANDESFAKELASLGDLYVNDTFSCSHRAHASIVGITRLLPSSAGFLLREEIDNLTRIFNSPKKPIFSIIGGSKISTKINLIRSLCQQSDFIFLAGAMANNFLVHQGYEIGKSLIEQDYLAAIDNILQTAIDYNCKIILPKDVTVADNLAKGAKYRYAELNDINKNEMILDIGAKTISMINQYLNQVKTLIWNGPLGAFEINPFAQGTIAIAQHAATLTKANKLYSVAGGGDIVAAISNHKLDQDFSYISTGGGAFLEWLEGQDLPGIKALKSSIV